MSELTVNIPMLRKAVEWAEAEDKKPFYEREWDQGGWARNPEQRRLAADLDGLSGSEREQLADCGTAYCIAGYICDMAGDKFVVDPRNDYMMSSIITEDGRTMNVSRRAIELLGIDQDDSDTVGRAFQLFDGGNNIEDVRRIAEELAGEKL